MSNRHPATLSYLWSLAGSQDRSRPQMLMANKVFLMMCEFEPPGLEPFMPVSFELEGPRMMKSTDFRFRDAYVRSRGATRADQTDVESGLLEEVFPDTWFDIAERCVTGDLEDLRLRMQHVIFCYADGVVSPNVRRPAAKRARNTVDAFRSECKRMLNLLAVAAFEGRRHAEFVLLPGERGGYIVVAPPLREVRRSLAAINELIASKMRGATTPEDELAWLAARRPATVRMAGLARAVRTRAIVALLLTTGARAGALARLTVADYRRQHTGPGPDYRSGPMILLTPRKQDGRWDHFPRPIPAEVGGYLDVYLAVREALRALEGLPPLAAHHSLIVGQMTADAAREGDQGITRWLNPQGGAPFVERRAEHRSPECGPDAATRAGYTAHELRHLSSQEAEVAGERWELRHPSREVSTTPASAYASALLLNGDERDRMRSLYGDRRTTAMIEVLAGRAAELIWEAVRSDLGLRRRPNVEAYRNQAQTLRRLEDEGARLAAKTSRMERRGRALVAVNGDATEYEVLLSHILEMREAMHEGFAIAQQLMAVHQRKEDCIKILDRLRWCTDTWVGISDDLPDGAERVDFDALDHSVLDHSLLAGEPARRPLVRDWLTVREFCRISDDLPRSTLTRWLNGENEVRAVHRRPWSKELVPLDECLGDAYRRIWVPGVNIAYWRTRLMRQDLADVLSRWPEGKGWTKKDGTPTPRCKAPLDLPADVSAVSNVCASEAAGAPAIASGQGAQYG